MVKENNSNLILNYAAKLIAAVFQINCEKDKSLELLNDKSPELVRDWNTKISNIVIQWFIDDSLGMLERMIKNK